MKSKILSTILILLFTFALNANNSNYDFHTCASWAITQANDEEHSYGTMSDSDWGDAVNFYYDFCVASPNPDGLSG